MEALFNAALEAISLSSPTGKISINSFDTIERKYR
jgi:hypothetical protein